MGEREPDFECAICQRWVDMRWNRSGADRLIAPICNWCQRSYGGHGTGLTAGSFRDRREVLRGFALSEALRCEAAQQKWRQADALA